MNKLNAISDETIINAPRDRVWEAIADLGGIERFHPGVSKSYYTTEQQVGEGACRHCTLKPMGSVEEKVVAWKEKESITLAIYESSGMPPMADFQGSFSIAPDGEGWTRLRFALQYRMKLGPLGAIMDAMMMRRQFERMIPAVVRGFKRGIEKG